MYFFDGIDSGNARLNLIPCTTVDADMCITKAQWMGGGDAFFLSIFWFHSLAAFEFFFGSADGDNGTSQNLEWLTLNLLGPQ